LQPDGENGTRVSGRPTSKIAAFGYMPQYVFLEQTSRIISFQSLVRQGSLFAMWIIPGVGFQKIGSRHTGIRSD
jgi:hypothetical protein